MAWGTGGDVDTLIGCGVGRDNPGHVTVARLRYCTHGGHNNATVATVASVVAHVLEYLNSAQQMK